MVDAANSPPPPERLPVTCDCDDGKKARGAGNLKKEARSPFRFRGFSRCNFSVFCLSSSLFCRTSEAVCVSVVSLVAWWFVTDQNAYSSVAHSAACLVNLR